MNFCVLGSDDFVEGQKELPHLLPDDDSTQLDAVTLHAPLLLLPVRHRVRAGFRVAIWLADRTLTLYREMTMTTTPTSKIAVVRSDCKRGCVDHRDVGVLPLTWAWPNALLPTRTAALLVWKRCGTRGWILPCWPELLPRRRQTTKSAVRLMPLCAAVPLLPSLPLRAVAHVSDPVQYPSLGGYNLNSALIVEQHKTRSKETALNCPRIVRLCCVRMVRVLTPTCGLIEHRWQNRLGNRKRGGERQRNSAVATEI